MSVPMKDRTGYIRPSRAERKSTTARLAVLAFLRQSQASHGATLLEIIRGTGLSTGRAVPALDGLVERHEITQDFRGGRPGYRLWTHEELKLPSDHKHPWVR